MAINNYFNALVTPLLTLGLILTLAQGKAQDEKKPGLLEKGKIKLKLNKAKRQYINNDIQGALNTCREVLNKDEGNAKAHFIIAESHYKIQNYDLALENLQKAYDQDPQVDEEMFLLFGKIYHRKGKLDDAIDSYEDFKESIKESRHDQFPVDKYLKQCRFAKEQRENPKSATIENLGGNVNTRFDEYTPSITSDGKTLVFTSRRPDTKGGGRDERGDHRYYEDVYITHKNEDGEWKEPKGIPGRINTVQYDAVLSIAPDGKSIYIYRNNTEHAGDIFISKKSDRTGKFRRPKLLPKPINTSYYEGSITSTASGNTLYFISERKGGKGQGDIYKVTRQSDRDEWEEAVNLGDPVNTASDEKFVYITPDGKTLFFASNGHLTLGLYDIFVTHREDGEWSEPENLGYPINTVNEESTFSLSSDYKTMYLAGNYIDKENLGMRDLYRIDVSDHEILSKHRPTPKAKITGTVKQANGSPLKCTVKIFDASNGEKVDEKKTNHQGEYEFQVPVDRNYELKIEHRGYKPIMEEIAVTNEKAGENIVRELTAKKE